MSPDYYIVQDHQIEGPYTIHQLRARWYLGLVTEETRYFQPGYTLAFPLRDILHELERDQTSSGAVLCEAGAADGADDTWESSFAS